MKTLFLAEVELLPALSFGGYILVLFLPIFFLLLIARFRGFFASIFFLPFALSGIYFASTCPAVMNLFTNIGLFGEGMVKGIEVLNNLYVSVHYGLFNKLANHISIDFIKNILISNWFGLVLYLILFVIFFAIFKKRKKRKEEDLF